MPDMTQQAPHCIVALAYEGLWPLEFGIAAEIFGWSRPELDTDWYDFRVVCSENVSRAVGGFTLTSPYGLDSLQDADTIIVPGWRNVGEPPPAEIQNALISAHERGARLVSYCSGAFVFAHSGLLDGRRATTHWRYLPMMRDRFPLIETQEDVLYVHDANIITSAGSSAAIDASLHVIRCDHGSAIANKIARSLVAPPHRDGGQSQYVEAPIQERPGTSIASVLDWARENLDKPLTVTELAQHAGMSDRTFLRRFRDGTGTTPLKWLRSERVFRAMSLLESTQMDTADIAHQCGFGATDTFRAVFRQVSGTSPLAYRQRFDARDG